MNKEQLLAQPDVQGFIRWMQEELPQLDVHLRFSQSRFVKKGLDERVKGIENVHARYCWASVWSDGSRSAQVVSDDWATTRVSLDRLRIELADALAAKCESKAYAACRAVLEWGGVSGAIPFLSGLRRDRGLVEYLENCISLFDLNGTQSLCQLNERSIQRFDAGMTKIHALIDKTGSPIYDSRVGAAIAMLYALYRQDATTQGQLQFPSGRARGAQIRDPGELGFAPSPQFFTRSVPDHSWARSQLELGWIIQATLAGAPEMFTGSQQERSHCFEAALFMLGYDLRCFFPNGTNPLPGARGGRRRARRTWVPTSAGFPQVFNDYLLCSRQAGHPADLEAFRHWLQDVRAYRKSTARSCCVPLRPSEFDLVSFSVEELEHIAKGGETGLTTLAGGSGQFIAGDEYEQVYLTNVYLCVRATEIARNHGCKPEQLLVRAGYAGKTATAKLIIRTGKALGRHFDLLLDDQPTGLFRTFFAQALEDLDQPLIQATRSEDDR